MQGVVEFNDVGMVTSRDSDRRNTALLGAL